MCTILLCACILIYSYDISRDAYFLWRDSGSPRQGMLFDMKNRTKARFKGAMRFIKNNEDTLKKDSLAVEQK